MSDSDVSTMIFCGCGAPAVIDRSAHNIVVFRCSECRQWVATMSSGSVGATMLQGRIAP